MVMSVVSPPVKSNSTDVKVPELGLNCGKVNVLVQSVNVDGMGVLVGYEIVSAQTGEATAKQTTASTKVHTRTIVGTLHSIVVSPKGKTPVQLLPQNGPKSWSAMAVAQGAAQSGNFRRLHRGLGTNAA
jgi:hypothetical protein